MKIFKYKEFLINRIFEDTQNGNVLDSIEKNSLDKIKNTVQDHNAHKSILSAIFKNIQKTDEQILDELIKTFKRWYKKDIENDSAQAGKASALMKDEWGSILIYNELDDVFFQILKGERDVRKLELQIQNRQKKIDDEKSNMDNVTKNISTQRINLETDEIKKTAPLSDELSQNVKRLKADIEKLKSKYSQKQKEIKLREEKMKAAAAEEKPEEKK